MSKVIYFRSKSAAGEYTCANGEIESAVNVHLRMVSDSTTGNSGNGSSGSGDGCGADDERFGGMVDPGKVTGKLNMLSSELLPAVEFALKPGVVAGWHNHPDNMPSITVEAPKQRDSSGWASHAARVLEKFGKEAEKAHLFIEPLLAFSALRLKNGKTILPSSPVLLMPNTSAPTVEGDDNFDLDSMTMAIPVKASRLCCRITVPDGFADWCSKIEGIGIFLSSPIPLYEHEEDLLPVHRASAGEANGAGFPQSWVPVALTDSEFTSRLLSVKCFRLVSEIPLESLLDYSESNSVEFNVPEFTDEAKKGGSVQGISAYTPDFLQHQGISAMTGCRISGRITLCDLTLTLPAPPPLTTMIPSYEKENTGKGTWNPDEDDERLLIGAEIEVSNSAGILHSSRYENLPLPDMALSESNFPKWLFIPHPDARQLTLMTSEATYIVPLKRHPLLNGAYYWCGSTGYKDLASTGVRRLAAIGFSSGTALISRDSYRLPNALWRSETDCELLFPDSLFMLPDVGRVIALCRAFRASGLVATTSPTACLFTAQGIYLLKEMDNGELRDAGLIANYVLASTESLAVLGKSIEFTANSGERIMISGTTVKVLSSGSTGVSGENGVIDGSAIPGASRSKGCIAIEAADPEQPIEIRTRTLKLDSLIPSLDNIRKALEGSGVIGNNSARSMGSPVFLPGNMNYRLWNLPAVERLELVRKITWSIELEGAFSRIHTGEPGDGMDGSLTVNDGVTLNGGLTMSLYGSDDLINWRLIGRRDRPYLRGLLTPGLRFGRLVITGYLAGIIEGIRISVLPYV